MNIHTGATQEVLNQARPATGWNAFSNDAVPQGVSPAVRPGSPTSCCAGSRWRCGDARARPTCNRNGPELRTHDRSASASTGSNFIRHGTNSRRSRLSTRSSSFSACLDDARGERSSGPRRDILHLELDRARRRLPDRHDLCRLPQPSKARVRIVAREDYLRPLRQTPASGCTEGWCQHRLRDDREAKRLRSPPDPDHGVFFLADPGAADTSCVGSLKPPSFTSRASP